jgi:hypothetical protein
MSLRFFYNFQHILHSNNIRIIFYYNTDYISNFVKELKKYCIDGYIELKSIIERPSSSYDLWIGYTLNGVMHHDWANYYEIQYKNIIAHMKLEDCGIVSSIWQPEPYLCRLLITLSEDLKNKDILIINSTAHSGQFTRDRQEMDDLCHYLHKSFKIITTRKIEGIPCTMDYDMRLQDIAAVGTCVKYVIAIYTGPLCVLYNEETRLSVKKWFLITTNTHHYKQSMIDYTMISDGILTPIYTYFKDLR